jgi:hypothetical protein
MGVMNFIRYRAQMHAGLGGVNQGDVAPAIIAGRQDYGATQSRHFVTWGCFRDSDAVRLDWLQRS